jgi:uncharacterized membrane protein YtjA (UPF0391 family)
MTFMGAQKSPVLVTRNELFPAAFFFRKSQQQMDLINWAIVFLVIALIAGLFGFGGLAGTAMGGAKLLFWVAIILFVASALAGLIRRRT